MSKVIVLHTPEGDKPYRPLSDRIGHFLNDYPPKDGFRVVVTRTDLLTHQRGLLQLYEVAVRSGQNPNNVGLPSISETPHMIFEASLLDAADHVISNATAAYTIINEKDWECGETAARQRLLAAMGYGGEVFDEDEAKDQRQMGLVQTDITNAKVKAVVPTSIFDKTSVATQTVSGNVDPTPAIAMSLVNEIAAQAKQRNVPVPTFTNQKDAVAALKALRQSPIQG